MIRIVFASALLVFGCAPSHQSVPLASSGSDNGNETPVPSNAVRPLPAGPGLDGCIGALGKPERCDRSYIIDVTRAADHGKHLRSNNKNAQATVGSFGLGTYEVTVAQFRQLVT